MKNKIAEFIQYADQQAEIILKKVQDSIHEKGGYTDAQDDNLEIGATLSVCAEKLKQMLNKHSETINKF